MEPAESFLENLQKRGSEPIFGGILITGALGQGGMGVVLRGIHLRLSIPVAVKFFSVDANLDMRLILNEARLAAKINHVNVARVYDINREGNVIYIVQELVDGHTLENLISQSDVSGLPSEPFVLSVAEDVARGLDAIHREGVVHRDIKPSNIMVTKDGRCAKILDLGIAHQVGLGPSGSVARSQQATEGMFGTLGYMSPEQMWRLPITFVSDFYSLGVTLVELLTGKHAFTKDSLTRLVAQVTEVELPDIRVERPDISEATAALLAKCTRIDPQERFQSAEELVKALESAKASVGSSKSNTARLEVQERKPQGPYVLCADDEPDIVDLVKASLETAGYSVIGCANGEEAVAQAAQRAPILAILDIDMPKMNGLETCRALRALPQFKDLPIVFLTGHSDHEAIRQALQEGATDYLIKPFNAGDLLDHVHCLSRLHLVREEMNKLNTRFEQFQHRLKGLLGE